MRSYKGSPGVDGMIVDQLEAARQHVAAGYHWVVDLDLEKFFDRVNHDILMGRLAKRIGDKRILHLLRRNLEAGVLMDGVVHNNEGFWKSAGTPAMTRAFPNARLKDMGFCSLHERYGP